MKTLKTQGNFLVILNEDNTEFSRHPLWDSRFQIYEETSENPLIKFFGVESEFNSKTNELPSFRFDELLDSLGVPFATIDDLVTWLSDNLGFNSALGGSSAMFSGWGVYDDTSLSSGVPLSLTAGAAYVPIPNNAGSKYELQKPIDVTTFYDGTGITGRNGDSILITISFAVRPLEAQPTRVTVVPDIGGGIGEITDYERDSTFSKGVNIVQRYLSTFNAYTLDTWEANGAILKIKSDRNCEIYDVRYLISRVHKAF